MWQGYSHQVGEEVAKGSLGGWHTCAYLRTTCTALTPGCSSLCPKETTEKERKGGVSEVGVSLVHHANLLAR